MKIEHLHRAIAFWIILVMCFLQLAPALHHHSFVHSESISKVESATNVNNPNFHCSFCDKTFKCTPHKVLPLKSLILVQPIRPVQKINIKRTVELVFAILKIQANKGPPQL